MTDTFPLADACLVVLRSDRSDPLAVCHTPHSTLEELKSCALDFLRSEVENGVLSQDEFGDLAIGVIQADGKILGLSVRGLPLVKQSLEWKFVLVPAELLPPPTNLH